jgi:RNA polymerase sigma-70 factor (ECF subfamily)
MDDQTDEMIAHKVQEGDVDAFGELVSRYERKLARYARKFLSRQEDIEDLVQDVFIRTYEHIQSFDVSQRFSPWIYRIAHNMFVNELKRRSRFGFGVFDPEVVFPFIPAKETADGDILRTELEAEIGNTLDTLPAKYREVVVLFYFENLSYQEISEIVQIPISTVGVRMNRARAKLAKAFNTEV